MSTTKYTDRTQLSPREAEIDALKSQGLSKEQIASRLCISEKTVGHHIWSINSRRGREKQ